MQQVLPSVATVNLEPLLRMPVRVQSSASTAAKVAAVSAAAAASSIATVAGRCDQ